MNHYKSIHAGLFAIAVLAMPFATNAELITYSGTFDAEDPTFTVTAISGTWTAVVDDSDFLTLSGVGNENVVGTVTSLAMSPSPLGSTTFDTTNTGFVIDVTDGIVGAMTIGGLLDGRVDSQANDLDDWFANYFPGVNFSANGAPLDGVAAEAVWSTALDSVNGGDSTHGGTISTTISQLQGRLPLTPGGTDYQAVYDADRDITWLANANAGAGSAFDDGISTTDGLMTWLSANAWAASLTLGGYTDWRLPTTTQPDPSCSSQQVDPDGVHPLQGFQFDCTASEMGHLFYSELSGVTNSSILTSGDPDLALFMNIQVSSPSYWSRTRYVLDGNQAWWFWFGGGQQNVHVLDTNKAAWAVREGDVTASGPIPTVRMQLDATSTSFFDDFTIVFEDTGDGLLQQEEIIFFSGVTGTSPTTGQELVYSGVEYVPAITGISTASGTINPTIPCAQCWEFAPGDTGNVSDGWFDTRWTYALSTLSALSQTINFSYTFDGTDGNAWSPGATLSGQIQGTIQADGDTVIIDSFGTVVLTRPGLPDFTYASIENDEFNAWPNVGDIPVMSFSGLKNNFRSCPEGFIAPFNDCAFGTSPGGGFLMSFDPSIFMGSWITAADGTGAATCPGAGAQLGCRVQDRPINLDNWSLTVEVPADDCTSVEGGCNPTGGHEFVLPDGFVVPDGGMITQTATPFVDPRADETGRCNGLEPLVLFDGDLIIPPHICGSPEFEVLETEANFEIKEGTILSTMFPEVFVSNPLDCMRPIIGDPQLQDIVVWQPTDGADVIEGRALELTFDCGSSRGKTRGFSFYVVGMHIDFGLDFDQDPEAVTQAFVDLTHTKIHSLVRAVVNARRSLSRRDFFRLLISSLVTRHHHKRGRFQEASRTLETFLRFTDRAQFDTEIGFNHEGNLLSRAENIKFTLLEKIIPFAKPPVRRRRWARR